MELGLSTNQLTSEKNALVFQEYHTVEYHCEQKKLQSDLLFIIWQVNVGPKLDCFKRSSSPPPRAVNTKNVTDECESKNSV